MRFLKILSILIAPFIFSQNLRAACVEVSMSTCVGDFPEGGTAETSDQLMGNTSCYSFGILQDNKVKVFISSGCSTFGVNFSSRAGFIGLFMEGMNQQLPQYHLDVWGHLRSTGTLILGTTQPNLTGGTTPYYFLVQNGTFTILKGGNVGIGTLSPSEKLEVRGNIKISGAGNKICLDDGSCLEPIPDYYNIVVGTPGSVGVDVHVSSSDSFDAMLATVGVRGLLQTSSVTATVFFKEGIYEVSSVTIPSGISIYCQEGSSTVFRFPFNSSKMFTIHGGFYGCTIDMQGRSYNNQVVHVGTGARIVNVNVVGGQNMIQTISGGGWQPTIFYVRDATDVVITGKVDGFAPVTQDERWGGLFSLFRSSKVYIDLDAKGAATTATTGKQFMGVVGCDEVQIRGHYHGVGARILVNYGGAGLLIAAKFTISQPLGIGFHIRDLQSSVSSGTVISSELIFGAGGSGSTIIQTQSGATDGVVGVLVRD